MSYQEARFVKFIFTSQNYYKSSKNQYAYRIKENGKEWLTLGTQNHVTLSNLASGVYTIEVVGSNNDGVWNYEDKVILTLKVNTVYWQTWWFRVLQRTQALKQEHKKAIEKGQTLRKTNQKLIELAEFKEVMMGGIVHDLKNPLNVLLNISDGFIDEGKRKTIQQTSLGMLNMVLNILDVQKFEETEVKLNMTKIDIKLAIKEAQAQVEFLLKEKFIELNTYIPKNVWVEADKPLITRVLVNLLTNAIKYSTNNSKIEILVEKMADTKQVSISIKDEGHGMTQEQIKEVFKKFKQFGNPQQSKIASTGLGLTFSKMAIEAHEGQIFVTSVPHKETTFSFTLPLTESQFKNDSDSLHETTTLQPTLGEMTISEKAVFQDYLKDLQSKEVYELSDIKEILANINFQQSENLSIWYKNMEETLYACNQAMYQKLLKMLHI